MAIGATLTKRVGPLPLWGWLVAGGGAAVVVFMMVRAKSSSSTTTNSTTGATSGTSPLDAYAGDYSGGQGTNLFSGDAATTSLLQQIESQLAAQQTGTTSATPSAFANDPAQAIYNAYMTYLGRPPTASELSTRLSLLGTNSLQSQINDIMTSAEAAAYYVSQQSHGTGVASGTMVTSAPPPISPPANMTQTSITRMPVPIQPAGYTA